MEKKKSELRLTNLKGLIKPDKDSRYVVNIGGPYSIGLISYTDEPFRSGVALPLMVDMAFNLMSSGCIYWEKHNLASLYRLQYLDIDCIDLDKVNINKSSSEVRFLDELSGSFKGEECLRDWGFEGIAPVGVYCEKLYGSKGKISIAYFVTTSINSCAIKLGYRDHEKNHKELVELIKSDGVIKWLERGIVKPTKFRAGRTGTSRKTEEEFPIEFVGTWLECFRWIRSKSNGWTRYFYVCRVDD